MLFKGISPFFAKDAANANDLEDTPAKVSDAQHMRSFRDKFNKKAFGIDSDGTDGGKEPVIPKNSIAVSLRTWRRMVTVLSNWGPPEAKPHLLLNDPEAARMSAHRKANPEGYTWVKKYAVVDSESPTGEQRKILKRICNRGNGRLVLCPRQRCLMPSTKPITNRQVTPGVIIPMDDFLQPSSTM